MAAPAKHCTRDTANAKGASVLSIEYRAQLECAGWESAFKASYAERQHCPVPIDRHNGRGRDLSRCDIANAEIIGRIKRVGHDYTSEIQWDLKVKYSRNPLAPRCASVFNGWCNDTRAAPCLRRSRPKGYHIAFHHHLAPFCADLPWLYSCPAWFS